MTFAVRAGAKATIGFTTVESGAAHIAFDGLHFRDGWEVGPSDDGEPAANVTFARTTGATFFIMNARNVRVLGGAYGPNTNGQPQIKVYNPSNTYAPTNILVDGVFFHDFTRSGPDVHTECLQILAGAGVTVRRSRFRNCDGTGSLAYGTASAAPLQDLLIENNMFERGDGVDEPYYDVQASACAQDVVFRYNTFVKGIVLHECDTGNGAVAIVGNYGVTQGQNICDRANARYAHNVWVGVRARRCASSDAVSPRLQVNGPNDLRLSKRSAAIDRGDPKEYPRSDFFRAKRPSGTRPDAGAAEYIKPKPKRG